MPPIRDVPEAARQLEAMFVRQLLSASGAFKPGAAAGGQIQTDMFVEALAEAVTKSGGFGIARMLERELGASAEGGIARLLGGDAGASAEDQAILDADVSAPGERPHAVHEHRAGSPSSTPGAAVITSAYGRRVDPMDGGTRFHTGVDLRGAEGTPIKAAAEGIVKSAGPRGAYGNAVEIDHGGGVTTLYGHAQQVTVRPGDRIAEGQEVALVGATGRATGPHLHFEVRVAGRPIDPTRALNAYGIRAEKTIGAKPSSSGFDVDP